MRNLFIAMFYAASFAAQAADAPGACQTAEYRQFDFWIGNWNVFTPDGKQVGTNRIERIAKGCALRENWTGATGVVGESLNIYDATDKLWHQSWVDSSGARLEIAGKFANKQMIMKAEVKDAASPSGFTTQRITWTPQNDGSVHQVWETSQDRGKTWTVAFDGKYVKQ